MPKKLCFIELLGARLSIGIAKLLYGRSSRGVVGYDYGLYVCGGRYL
ncbi:uncharacterized protein G2W53_022024 [Senna tora]|uniref:Uncharacterized protein n=1 Tax=Senna tora TaxID=362788 RepID=A0A834WHS1_9FABA|nr:uncharacterized protein G2W53_022024 [Senna tora]